MSADAPPPPSRREIWVRLLLYPGHTLPTAAAPLLVGTGLAVHDGCFAPVPALLAFIGSWLIHVAGVFTDNLELLRRHPHLPEHPELTDAVAARTLTFTTLRVAIAGCLLLAIAAGAALVVVGGLPALLLGVVGVAASLGYAGGPFPYAARGLADVVFFVMFGVVAVAATWYIQAVWTAPVPLPSWWSWRATPPATAWLVGLPVGATITAVLVIDDIRDRAWDAAKGWRTGAVRGGIGWSRAEIALLLTFAYLAPLAFWWWLGFGAAVLLPWLTAPLAWRLGRALGALERPADLQPFTPRMARLALLHAALLGVGVALG